MPEALAQKKGSSVFRSFMEIAGNEGTIPSTIQILNCGSWNTTSHGSFVIGEGDLDEMVKNFNDSVRKGVPIDIEHDTTGGAVGWIESLYRKGKELWANVSWNKRGSDALADKQYCFFSPEFAPEYQDPETGSLYKNVLLGGGITNRPLFKNLKPIIASDGTKNNVLYLNEDTMDIEALKAKDPATLTDEEKQFLTDNPTPEAPAETPVVEPVATPETPAVPTEAPVETPTEPVQAAETVTISAAEKARYDAMALKFAELEKETIKAKEELRFTQCSETVKGWLFNEKGEGSFPPSIGAKLTQFVFGLNESKAKEFSELVAAMPKGTKMFSELGSDSGGGERTPSASTKNGVKGEAAKKFSDKVDELMRNRPELDLLGAQRSIRASEPELFALVREENEPFLATRSVE